MDYLCYMKTLLRTIAVILAASSVLASCGAGSSPQATAKKFYRAIADGDYSRALEYTNMTDDDTELYYAIMEKVNLSIEEKGGIDKIEIIREIASADRQSEEEPQRTVVLTRISYADGSSQEEYCDMVMSDGKWMVDVDINSK